MIKYELALFAGSGGGILASEHLLGFRTVCAVEKDPYCIGVLLQRQNDGALDAFPVWDDVVSFTEEGDTTFWMFHELRQMRSELIVTAGFPCQDISMAGGD